MPRVLLLTQFFPPEIGAAQTRLFELGQELSRLGWEVEVLTALPNYPTGRVFEGYRTSTPVRETIGQLSVVRVPLRPAQKGFVNRLICYFSFVRSAVRQTLGSSDCVQCLRSLAGVSQIYGNREESSHTCPC
jgi:hypothetical protein